MFVTVALLLTNQKHSTIGQMRCISMEQQQLRHMHDKMIVSWLIATFPHRLNHWHQLIWMWLIWAQVPDLQNKWQYSLLPLSLAGHKKSFSLFGHCVFWCIWYVFYFGGVVFLNFNVCHFTAQRQHLFWMATVILDTFK